MTRKKSIIITVIAIVLAGLIAFGMMVLLQNLIKKDTASSGEPQQPSTSELKASATEAEKSGETALQNGDYDLAAKKFEDAKALYQQSGDYHSASKMDAHISLSKHQATMQSEQKGPVERAPVGSR